MSAMYKYTAIIICFFCFFLSACEDKTSPPPPKSKIVHKKIDPKPAVQAARETPPAAAAAPKATPPPQSGLSEPPEGAASAAPLPDATAMKADATPASGTDPAADKPVPGEAPLNNPDLQEILNLKDGSPREKPSGYSALNKVDPFEPLFKPVPAEKPKPPEAPEKPAAPQRRLTPLEKVDLDQLKLVGIVRTESGNKALVEDASGKGYIVIQGTYIGIHSGKVMDILKDRIIVEEADKDMLGNVRVHKREMKFQRPSGDEYYEM